MKVGAVKGMGSTAGKGFWGTKSEGAAPVGWDWPGWERGIFGCPSHGFRGVAGQSLLEASRSCVCCSLGKISWSEAMLVALME